MNAKKAAILLIERGRKGAESKKERVGYGRTTGHDVKHKSKPTKINLKYIVHRLQYSRYIS